MHGPRGVAPGSGTAQDAGVDVRGDDLHIPVRDSGPVFEQVHGDGIRLLARRRGNAPDADRVRSGLVADNFREDGIDEALELVLLTQKVRFVYRHQVGELLQFFTRRLKAQKGKVPAKVSRTGRFNPFNQTLVDKVALGGLEADAGSAIEELFEFQEVVNTDVRRGL